MMTTWKFPLQLTDGAQVLQIPQPAVILTCQIQDGLPCLWAVVDTDKERETVAIYIVGTGYPLQDGLTYIATLQFAGGSLVLHVFAETVRATDIGQNLPPG